MLSFLAFIVHKLDWNWEDAQGIEQSADEDDEQANNNCCCGRYFLWRI